MCPLPKRFFDPIESLPEKIETFEDCHWMLLDESRKTAEGLPHGLIWMQPIEAKVLWDLVQYKPPGNIVEIGRCEGGSTILMGAAKEPDEILYSIDNDPVDDAHLSLMLERLEIQNVMLIVGDSMTYDTSAFPDISLLLIDGGHAYRNVLLDYLNWFPRVQVGGLIVMHDVKDDPAEKPTGPKQVYNEMIAAGGVEPLLGAGSLGVLRRLQ